MIEHSTAVTGPNHFEEKANALERENVLLKSELERLRSFGLANLHNMENSLAGISRFIEARHKVIGDSMLDPIATSKGLTGGKIMRMLKYICGDRVVYGTVEDSERITIMFERAPGVSKETVTNEDLVRLADGFRDLLTSSPDRIHSRVTVGYHI